MRSDLDHLPSAKRRDLERIVQILFAEFEDATAIATQAWKKQGRILKVILYGSYARGDWVDDPVGGYFSDYDILVVVSDERLTDPLEYWAKADEHLTREVTIAKRIGAPVAFIVHSLADVNDQLQRGRPFFVDIVRDGIALYEVEGHDFAEPRNLPASEEMAEASKNFGYWLEQADSARLGADFYIQNDKARDAAFLLHQAAERLYHCALLTITLYSPKSHKLNFLRAQAEPLVPELIDVWPRNTKFAQRCFELLRQAYVNARYSPHYKITAEELDWLGERIAALQAVVKKVCQDHLAALAQAAQRPVA